MHAGYLTEASSSSTAAKTRLTATRKTPKLGPLSSARARTRRSRSAGAIQTPSVLHSIKAKKQPMHKNALLNGRLQQQPHSLDESSSSSAVASAEAASARMSRAKFRTPDGRLKAASADRAITPKVHMGTPMAVLRYPRMGETLLSTSGSPVAGMPPISDMANIAIPVSDGVISVRPTSFGEFDRHLLTRIDSSTLAQLKKLQDNLSKVIKNFDTK